MSDDEIIAVVKAHKEGKKIQYRFCVGEEQWQDMKMHDWDFQRNTYHVAPEPRKPIIEPDRDTEKWWAEIPLDGSVGQIFTDSRQLTKGGKLIRVMQVPE
jgi:hypothetical protein